MDKIAALGTLAGLIAVGIYYLVKWIAKRKEEWELILFGELVAVFG